jgi:3-hydroxyacyl-CoA dehydrogenase/enoyl-CoA hydratase/3-hydroxybutyryl-CoA epimerase
MMLDDLQLSEFRVEPGTGGTVHLVFDALGRSMNVFSNAAIAELGRFADWLMTADVAGVVVRSGKAAFCAGADLTELGVAYDMIMAAPKPQRQRVAFDHFFPLSQALRRLETSGKPVAAALGGLALGGGCELALACHYRVLVESPQVFLGLPESLVGLLPGAGGTQRLPRLMGATAALPVLLDGARLTARQALSRGVADEVVTAGEEVAAAERWVLTAREPRAPWDRPTWGAIAPAAVQAVTRPVRSQVLEETNGHYPAPLAILDCVERGLPQEFDDALRTEMEIFAALIERPEPRNMIQTMFLGKQDHARLTKAATLPAALGPIRDAVSAGLARAVSQAISTGADRDEIARAARAAGFKATPEAWRGGTPAAPTSSSRPGRESAELWFEGAPVDDQQRLGKALLLAAATAAQPYLGDISEAERRMIDFDLVTALGFPAYLGGPLALADYLGNRIGTEA